MNPHSSLRIALVMALLPFVLLFAGCDAESPTEPAPQAQNTDTTGPAQWNIAVTAQPDEFDINEGSGTSAIEVRATRVSNGARPAPGTTAVVSTTDGTLTSSLSTGSSVPVEFAEDGVARATLETGDFENPGTIIVRGQLEGSFASVEISMRDDEVETGDFFGVTQISPIFGPPSGGTLVEVQGAGFEFPLKAVFVENGLGDTILNGISLTDIEIQSSSRFTARTPRVDLPAGENVAYDLVVEKGQSGQIDSLPDAFTYTRSEVGPAQLLLISVTPSSGPNEGGTEVLIRGDGFGQQAQVFFSNGPLIEATVLEVTRTTIRAITPSATGPNAANANSRVSVTVRDPVTGQEETLDNAFQYGADDAGMFISAIGPSEAEYLGGVNVTVFGQGFDEPVAVEAGGVGQQPISITGTEVVFRAVPVSIECSDQSGAVSVTNIETSETVSGPNFTYRPVEPLVLSVSPGSGPENGGNTVIVNGIARSFARGFQLPVRVLFNGRPAGVISLSADGSALEVIVPAFTGTFETEACESGGETGSRNVPFAADVEVINLDTGCTDTLAEAYLYIPDDESCQIESDGGGVISP